MKVILGLLGAICGLILGLYVWIWILFTSGVADINFAISEVSESGKVTPIIYGITKIIFAPIGGIFTTLIILIPSIMFILHVDNDHKTRGWRSTWIQKKMKRWKD